jgi:hypothetical protein
MLMLRVGVVLVSCGKGGDGGDVVGVGCSSWLWFVVVVVVVVVVGGDGGRGLW